MINPSVTGRWRLARPVLLAAALLATAPAAAQSDLSLSVSPFRQAVAENLNGDPAVASFYRARDFEPLWTGSGEVYSARRAALLDALSNADAHGLPARSYDASGLVARMSAARSADERAAVEIALSETYLRFARDIQSGILEPNAVVSAIKRERPERDADALLARIDAGDARKVLRDLAPDSLEYTRLMRTKMLLERTISLGGWGMPVRARALEAGDRGDAVVALRDRLVTMDYLPPHLGTRYDERMETAVRQFQQDHGLEVDGVAGPSTLSAINVPPEERLKSVIVAMERERWLNLEGGRGDRHVVVNLADFHAQLIDDGKTTFRTRSVVGHQDRDRQSPEFSDVMEHMVINPYWYVPRSIIVDEYLPAMRRNPYAHSHLDVIDSSGRVVNRGRGFARYNSRTFPFSMRQKPGPENALGTVKFMFPNRYNIYLHDTPAKQLFSRSTRTFSHGCIRLQDPHEFAYALLAPQQEDPERFFQSILQTGRNTTVPLEQNVPVHLDYRTAFTQAKGNVQYREDVYGRDGAIWRALADAGVALRIGQG
ncbi:L,D-transpeptidase family protein [Citreimonas salinaria]|uniref:Murein L,D-transpeptidase YcbB/YkuD n=1 Tax=Citreimonas salinaria TaxID=321339 RepID=A0A1H3IKB6_9RHOB|nr:L,D-transpeptidase family protein [Citreimonas salinaria]SDY27729.1 Murein L,D-transpeptidase YcbB/YkuD [Citreimonas salinaria]